MFRLHICIDWYFSLANLAQPQMSRVVNKLSFYFANAGLSRGWAAAPFGERSPFFYKCFVIYFILLKVQRKSTNAYGKSRCTVINLSNYGFIINFGRLFRLIGLVPFLKFKFHMHQTSSNNILYPLFPGITKKKFRLRRITYCRRKDHPSSSSIKIIVVLHCLYLIHNILLWPRNYQKVFRFRRVIVYSILTLYNGIPEPLTRIFFS